LFTDREVYQPYCVRLRAMSVTGEGTRYAPWQLPCWRNRVNRDFVDMPARLHPFLEMHAVTQAAALVFVDAPNFRLDDPDQSVGIVALALNAEGRRATALAELAPVEAAPAAFVRTNSDADVLAAVYLDEAPGRAARATGCADLRTSPTPVDTGRVIPEPA
jgi:hypothetical protein